MFRLKLHFPMFLREFAKRRHYVDGVKPLRPHEPVPRTREPRLPRLSAALSIQRYSPGYEFDCEGLGQWRGQPVFFKTTRTELWLASLYFDFRHHKYHRMHSFSSYQLFSVTARKSIRQTRSQGKTDPLPLQAIDIILNPAFAGGKSIR